MQHAPAGALGRSCGLRLSSHKLLAEERDIHDQGRKKPLEEVYNSKDLFRIRVSTSGV